MSFVSRQQDLHAAAPVPAMPAVDWAKVVRLLSLSRALDDVEETTLIPAKKVLYQFSARGHDMAQILLGLQLAHPHDAVAGYYRSRPLLLSLGVTPLQALKGSMGRRGGYSDGRDIGVVFNYPNPDGATALPMCGGVGTQYTPAAGHAQAVAYRRKVLNDPAFAGAIGVALGGDASVATNGFWAALTIATTLRLPMLFYIEDNGYGISVPSDAPDAGRQYRGEPVGFREPAYPVRRRRRSGRGGPPHGGRRVAPVRPTKAPVCSG